MSSSQNDLLKINVIFETENFLEPTNILEQNYLKIFKNSQKIDTNVN